MLDTFCSSYDRITNCYIEGASRIMEVEAQVPQRRLLLQPVPDDDDSDILSDIYEDDLETHIPTTTEDHDTPPATIHFADFECHSPIPDLNMPHSPIPDLDISDSPSASPSFLQNTHELNQECHTSTIQEPCNYIR
jgi:hypothetical protein